MKFLSLPGLTENKYFDISGRLTVSGQYKFWRVLDSMLQYEIQHKKLHIDASPQLDAVAHHRRHEDTT